MKALLAPWKTRNALAVAVLAAAALVVVAPAGLGLSSGMNKDVGIFPGDFAKNGCTSCHGTAGAFAAPTASTHVAWSMVGADGKPVAGNAYAKGAVYNITITLLGEQAPGADNHAGFNLAASAGKLSAPASDPDVQVSTDQTQATHKRAANTRWSVQWTAPDAGAAVFDLFVNDVNGDSSANAADKVYRAGWWLTDGAGAQAGAAAEAEHVEFGISLQQYWIGLIGLAGMLFIMVAGYLYLKYGSGHNSDEKDR